MFFKSSLPNNSGIGFPLEEVSKIAEETLNTTKKLVDDTLVEWEQTKKVDKEVEDILHQVEFDFIKQSLLHDLGTENG